MWVLCFFYYAAAVVIHLRNIEKLTLGLQLLFWMSFQPFKMQKYLASLQPPSEE